ncbi:MAG: TolC family protein [Treponema sp.]|nr:TolC family protein [Treponema sp.]
MKKTILGLLILTAGLFSLAAQEEADQALAGQETAAQAQEEAAPALTFEEALQAAVENNADIQIKKAAVQEARGRLLSAKAGTDFTIGADAAYNRKHTPYGNDPYYGANGIDDLQNDSINTSIWAQKTFSFGLRTKISAGINSALGKYKGSKGSDYNRIYGDEFTNRGTIALELSLPLFKSFKNAILANNIQAANDYCAQIEFDLLDTICKTLQNAAATYWEYHTAHRQVQHYEEILKNLQDRIESMDKLIAAGARTKNDLLSLQVNIISNERSLLSSKVKCNEIKLKLQQMMGTQEEIGIPEYDFPSINVEAFNIPALESVDNEFIEKTISKRPDILSMQKRLDYARANLVLAVAQGRPDLALNLSLGETGAVYGESVGGFFSSFFRNVNGANFGGGLSFSMSFPNNAKNGAVQSAEAQCTQASVQLNQAKQTLALQLRNTVFNLNNYKIQVQNANSALEMQKQLYANEQRRFNSGLITVDDMINQDKEFILAKNQYYQIMATFLQNIMQYKYFSGMLAEITNSGSNVLRKESLYSLQN